MRIVNEQRLDTYRAATRCEYCKRALRGKAEPHHILTRAVCRLDVSPNIIALGNSFECGCHARIHNAEIARCDFLAVVSQREGLVFSEREWLNAVYLFVRAPKNADAEWFRSECEGWSLGERELVRRIWSEVQQ